MPVAWPPSTALPWPPSGYAGAQVADLDALTELATDAGWVVRAPTSQESRTFFRDARCDDGHSVTGVMLVTPTAVYPFARCNGTTGQRVFLVLWPGFVWGAS